MSKNIFYEKRGPFPIKEVIKVIGFTGSLTEKKKILISIASSHLIMQELMI